MIPTGTVDSSQVDAKDHESLVPDGARQHGHDAQLHDWEQLVLSVSTGLISKDAASLDDALHNAVAQLGGYSGADRCYVFLYDDDGDTMSNSHEWCRGDIAPQRDELQSIPCAVWPYWMAQLSSDGIVDWPLVAKLPDAGAAERDALTAQGVQSVVAVALQDGERLLGFVGFDSVASEQFWGPDQVYLLRMSANVIASALIRLHAEQALSAARAQLRHTTQLESLGRFVGGTAHDFNNLLTVILGNCELAGMTSDQHAIRGYVSEIQSAADQAAMLIRSLLAFGRRQVADPSVVGVNEFMTRTRSFLDRIVGETIQIDMQLDTDAGHILIDEGQMQNVLLNLTANARDAMPDGGRLTFETRCSDNATSSSAVQIVVTDTGCGMDQQTLERAFDPFFTTKAADAGTGLGLSSVHGIVVQNGGAVSIASAPGQGTTVRIALPRVAPNSAGTVVAGHAKSALPAPRGTVLLVEDDSAVLNVIDQMLRREGLSVVTAQSSEAALQILADQRLAIDILLTDVVLPGMSGVELIERLRASRPDLPVIAMSGYSDETTALANYERSTFRLVAKPIDHDRLMSLLAVFLDQ